jgi:hypothetical protein
MAGAGDDNLNGRKETLAPAACRALIRRCCRASAFPRLPVPIPVLHWMGFMASVTITLTGIRTNSAASASNAYGAPGI